METFNVKKATNDIIEYLRDWFDTNGHGCNAIIGMSGGKDSCRGSWKRKSHRSFHAR